MYTLRVVRDPDGRDACAERRHDELNNIDTSTKSYGYALFPGFPSRHDAERYATTMPGREWDVVEDASPLGPG